MERHREPESQALLGEPADLRHEPARGHGDAPDPEVQAVGLVKDAHRMHDGAVIGQRLAHAHEDEVEARVLPAMEVAHGEHLGDDLVSLEVALEPHQAGGAEGALERASHLAREAEGEAPRRSHRHALDSTTVAQLENELVGRAIGGRMHRGGVGKSEVADGSQASPEPSRQVGHVLGAAKMLPVNPREELRGSIGGEPLLAHSRRELVTVEAVEARRGGGAAGDRVRHGMAASAYRKLTNIMTCGQTGWMICMLVQWTWKNVPERPWLRWETPPGSGS